MGVYNKIIVIGSPGSGKSYVSKKLAEILNLPLIHLDNIYWQPNWQQPSHEEFDKKIEEISNEKSWIIDGNYQRTLELRIQKCDLIIFLNVSTRVCLKSERKRRNNKRTDFPDYLEEYEDLEFIEFIKNFKKNNHPIIYQLLEKYPNKKVILLKGRRRVNKYIKKLEKKGHIE